MKYRFANVEIDTENRTVSRDGVALHLERRVFDLLVLLVQCRSKIVSKEDLIEKVWGGRIISDAAISTCINGVRRAVGDDGRRQDIIQTRYRSGFRFVASVQEVNALGPSAPQVLSGAPRLAVLPFTNLKSGTSDDLMGRGLAEEIVSVVARTRWIEVIAHGATDAIRGPAPDSRSAAADLGVSYVLQGTFLQSDDRVRLNVSLLDGASGQYLSAFKVDQAYGDLFQIIDDIAMKTVAELVPKIADRELVQAKRKRSTDLDAWEMYLRGKDLIRLNTIEASREAAKLLSEAVIRDPSLASAHAKLATCAIHEGYFNWTGRRISEIADEAHGHSRRALEADPYEALAYDALASAHQLVGELREAEYYARRAISLSPVCTSAYGTLITTLAFRGECEEALDLYEKMSRVSSHDPERSSALMGACIAEFYLGRLDRSLSRAKEHIALRPNWYGSWIYLAANLGHLGRVDDAVEALDGLLQLLPGLTIAELRRRLSGRVQTSEHIELVMEGLRLAGLEEGD